MNFRTFSSYFLGVIFIVAGIAHFTNTFTFMRFLPNWVPQPEMIVWISGVLEFILGVCMFFPRTRSLAALGILVLLVLFLPLHIIDLNRLFPVIGSKTIAWIRLPIQGLLIYMAYLAANWDKSRA